MVNIIDIDAIERENELLLEACRAAHAWLQLGLRRGIAGGTLCPEGLTRAEALVAERLAKAKPSHNSTLMWYGK